MKRIMSIAELGVNDIPIAGGKAANLGELTSAGFNVPEGFVLTTVSYDYFLEKNDLLKHVSPIIDKVDVTSEASLQDCSHRIRKAFDDAQVPEDLRFEILKEFHSLFESKKKLGLVAD
jgi:pyruvate,water dikinase